LYLNSDKDPFYVSEKLINISEDDIKNFLNDRNRSPEKCDYFSFEIHSSELPYIKRRYNNVTKMLINDLEHIMRRFNRTILENDANEGPVIEYMKGGGDFETKEKIIPVVEEID
jgi:hypothetical protein